VVVSLGLLVACGDDDDGTTPQDAYCEAGAELRASVGELADLDLLSEGTNGLQTRVQAIEDDLSTMRAAASDAAADELDALRTAVGDLGDVLAAIPGDLSRQTLSDVSSAVTEVTSAAQDVYATLSDCPD
jgi:hypothetical protein